MSESIVAEGTTTNEAIENGLKKLNVSKEMVDIKVLEEDKKNFFSILSPRVVKVQLTLKENFEEKKINKKEIKLSEDEQNKAKENIENFLNEILPKIKDGIKYTIEPTEERIIVNLYNEELGFLIGYRGETLYAFQNILSAVAGKGIHNKVIVFLDIEGYKEKRRKTLEDLAERMAKIAIKTRKPITLEPMKAYERKIIHTKLQENELVETKSIGEEPRRKVVIYVKDLKF